MLDETFLPFQHTPVGLGLPYDFKHKKLTFGGFRARLVWQSCDKKMTVSSLHQKAGMNAMDMKKTVIFFLLWGFISHAEGAYVANRDFLSVGHGARANAMGETYVAVADDNTAIYWNPAGLTQLKEDELSLTYSDRFDGLANEAQLHYARRTRKAMWGFGYVGSFVKDIAVTPSLSQAEIDAIGTGTFVPQEQAKRGVSDNAFLISYGRPVRLDSPHSLGATVKVIYRDILGMVQGYGTGVDVGYHYASQQSNWRFGANLQNAASITSFQGDINNIGVRATATESYIPTIKSGLAYEPSMRLLTGKILLAFDVTTLTSFDMEDYRAGIEYSFGDILALRAGKVFGRQDSSGDDYTLGMGLQVKSLIIDFSFLTNELGDTTRATLRYRLGGNYYEPAKY